MRFGWTIPPSCYRRSAGVLALVFSIALFYWSTTSGPGNRSAVPGMKVLLQTAEDNQRAFRKDVRLLAYFYPQYHRIPENDEFWGAGFTEWNNVNTTDFNIDRDRLAVPGELGYYNLLDVNIRRRQAELAREHGISGFVYHHYWFMGRTGKERLMYEPLDLMLKDGEPNLPFFLHWANEPWTRRWDGNGAIKEKGNVLLAMDYRAGEDDWRRHFETLLPFFNNTNYIRIDGKPVFSIYKLRDVPEDVKGPMLAFWRRMAIENGLKGLHIVAGWFLGEDEPLADGLMEYKPHGVPMKPAEGRYIEGYRQVAYRHLVDYPKPWPGKDFIRGTMVSFDNSRRHAKDLKESSEYRIPRHPLLWQRHLEELMDQVVSRDPPLTGGNHRYLVVTAWNEWGENSVLEPERTFGRAILESTRTAMTAKAPPRYTPSAHDPPDVLVLVGVRPSDVQATAGILDVERLLKSLQLQRNPRWLALVYPLPNNEETKWSSRLLEDITRMTQRDSRIQRVWWELAPGVGDQAATERALLEGLRTLAPSAEWVLLTNGSGLIYKPHALDSLTGGADVVGLGVTRQGAEPGGNPAVQTCVESAKDEGMCERNGLTSGQAALGTQLVKRARVTESLSDFVRMFYGNATGPIGRGQGWIRDVTEECHVWAGESPPACRAANGVWLVGQKQCIDPLADDNPLYWQLTNVTDSQYTSFVRDGTCLPI